MLSPTKIHEKRLKRKRKLERRFRCHGSTRPCTTHFATKRPRIMPFRLRAEAPRVGFVRRIINWLKNLFV